MRARAVVLILLLVAPAVAFAGCVGPTTVETEVFGNGQRQQLQIGMPEGEPQEPSPDATVTPGPEGGPPIFHNGSGVDLVAHVLVQERGRGVVRAPCGGASVAIPAGAPDPRVLLVESRAPDLPPVRYVASRMVTDGWGREWTTDRYEATQTTVNRTWPIWVANVHGGLAFTPDDGRAHCPPVTYGSTPFNVLLHPWGHPTDLDVYFAPTARFPEPAQRTWITGPVD